MVSTFSNQLIEGQLRQVQQIRYSNGIVSKRIFENPGDTVPMDVVWVTPDVKPVKAADVIEHREVQLYNRYFKSLHGEG
jgi:hypothetical protein